MGKLIEQQPRLEQLGLKHGVRSFSMTDVQPNGKVTVSFYRDNEFMSVELDKESAIWILAAFEGGKEWMREELRLLLNVPEKRP